MKTFSSNANRWLTVVIYAIAMAWVESAVVFYLRTMVDRIDPYQPNPLPVIGRFGTAEVVREAATLVMLLTVWGTLASSREMQRLARANWNVWLLNLSGICLALYLFMADNLRLGGRPNAWRDALPAHFNWLLFAIA